MIHFIYLLVFSVAIAVVFGTIEPGDTSAKIKHGVKTFLQFVLVSLVMAWVFYFIPF